MPPKSQIANRKSQIAYISAVFRFVMQVLTFFFDSTWVRKSILPCLPIFGNMLACSIGRELWGQDGEIVLVKGKIEVESSHKRVSLKIPIKNHSESTFTVKALEASCNCTKPHLGREVLSPRELVNLYTTVSIAGRTKVGSQLIATAEDSVTKRLQRIVDIQILVANPDSTKVSELEIQEGRGGNFSYINRSPWPIDSLSMECSLQGVEVDCTMVSPIGQTPQEFNCEVRNVSNVLTAITAVSVANDEESDGSGEPKPCTRAESVGCPERPDHAKCNTITIFAEICGNGNVIFGPIVDEARDYWWVCPVLCYGNCPDNSRQTDDVSPGDELKVIPTPLPPTGMANVVYVVSGMKKKVCYRVVPCRTNPEVSTLDDPEQVFECWIGQSDGTFVYDGTNVAGRPDPILGKKAWCVPAQDPPGHAIDSIELEWYGADEDATCKALYGPPGEESNGPEQESNDDDTDESPDAP